MANLIILNNKLGTKLNGYCYDDDDYGGSGDVLEQGQRHSCQE
jgi:hypothetical protein